MNLPAPALIKIRTDTGIYSRIAAFTWQTATGIAWVEDTYLDGAGSHSFHQLDGTLTEVDGGIYMTLPDGRAQIFSQEKALAEPELVPDYQREGFQGLQDNFAQLGLDWAAEFARITKALESELTPPA